ncbi:hypothetical protein GDO81_016070 [Engystomops pustulosus]|uniref:Uncharacterized protein n=1 Tax=Engystomops pustulosus TaxID=76066 RepID=A0AAV7AZ95_ENGPU|nr:hypothetical protein GDO81_016070 [Engystomops pustulosus]
MCPYSQYFLPTMLFATEYTSMGRTMDYICFYIPTVSVTPYTTSLRGPALSIPFPLHNSACEHIEEHTQVSVIPLLCVTYPRFATKASVTQHITK